jgi:hypothetical protein
MLGVIPQRVVFSAYFLSFEMKYLIVLYDMATKSIPMGTRMNQIQIDEFALL